ncbi:MAG: ATP-binding protein [Otoolea sp.]|nr:HAMP domain-containing sensor histidine kinase [Clostridium sp.]MDY5483929.1 HAMP domain-containing sensor histidine kinase [Clostridium sp.]
MKKWFDRLSSWFFQIENEILVPFLLVEILVILGFFGISFYNGYTMQLENQRAMAETLFTEVNRDINFLAERMPEALLREKYREYGNGRVRITDANGEAVTAKAEVNGAKSGTAGAEYAAEPDGREVLLTSREENVLGWTLEFLIDRKDFGEMVLEKQNYVVVGAIAALLMIAQASIFISHSITRPIRRMSRTCRQIEENKDSYRSYKFASVGRKDEIGQLAVTFEGLLKNMENYTKMEYTSRMSATLAHEIKNPIAGIRSGIQLLKGRAEKEGDQMLCDSMIHEIDRVNTLIMNLFTLSVRRESPKTEVSLERVLKEIAMIYAKEPGGQKASLEVKTEAGFTGWLNENEFRQIIHNLISNSTKAMVPGREGWIRMEGKTVGEMARIDFRDNGKGMTEEELSRAMEPFYTKSINGIGLGLSIVKKLVEQNEGTMKISSFPGEGTLITLEFPRKAV